MFDKPHFRYGNATSFVTLPHPAFENRGDVLWEAKHPAPLVQWFGKVDIVEQRKVLDAVRASEDPDGVRRRAILEPIDAARMGNAHALESAEPDARVGTLVRYEPDEIVFTIDAPRTGLVVLNEIMFPGWQVTLDGKDATPLRANYLMRAVEVGPGTHTIIWHFQPRLWRPLVGGYLLALMIMLAAVVVSRRRPAG